MRLSSKLLAGRGLLAFLLVLPMLFTSACSSDNAPLEPRQTGEWPNLSCLMDGLSSMSQDDYHEYMLMDNTVSTLDDLGNCLGYDEVLVNGENLKKPSGEASGSEYVHVFLNSSTFESNTPYMTMLDELVFEAMNVPSDQEQYFPMGLNYGELVGSYLYDEEAVNERLWAPIADSGFEGYGKQEVFELMEMLGFGEDTIEVRGQQSSKRLPAEGLCAMDADGGVDGRTYGCEYEIVGTSQTAKNVPVYFRVSIAVSYSAFNDMPYIDPETWDDKELDGAVLLPSATLNAYFSLTEEYELGDMVFEDGSSSNDYAEEGQRSVAVNDEAGMNGGDADGIDGDSDPAEASSFGDGTYVRVADGRYYELSIASGSWSIKVFDEEGGEPSFESGVETISKGTVYDAATLVALGGETFEIATSGDGVQLVCTDGVTPEAAEVEGEYQSL